MVGGIGSQSSRETNRCQTVNKVHPSQSRTTKSEHFPRAHYASHSGIRRQLRDSPDMLFNARSGAKQLLTLADSGATGCLMERQTADDLGLHIYPWENERDGFTCANDGIIKIVAWAELLLMYARPIIGITRRSHLTTRKWLAPTYSIRAELLPIHQVGISQSP